MKRCLLILALGTASTLLAQEKRAVKDPPPPVVKDIPAAPSEQVYIYDQQPVQNRPVLVSQEQANNVLQRFRAAYPELGSPRMVLFVNRELVDEQSGMRLTGRTERTQRNTTQVETDYKADPNAPAPAQAQSTFENPTSVTIIGDVGQGSRPYPGSATVNTKTEKTTSENSYKGSPRNPGTLADKQTVRDVQRLFGRPLRLGGARLADQRIATQLIPSGSLKSLGTEGEQARKDREALQKIADVAVEILISSRPINVQEVSGVRTYNVPDIQATAIRLSDAAILGQATASDIIGKDAYAGNIARNFDVREIAEATALALMEDMLINIDLPENQTE